MADWPLVRVRELARPGKRWALNGGPFGSKLTSRDYVAEGVPVIRGTNISGPGRFSFQNFVFVSSAKADDLLANNAHPGDIVFTQRGTLGQVGVIPMDSPYARFVVSQSQMKLTPDLSRVDPAFVYYFFSNPATVEHLSNHGMAAGVPHINLETLREFKVPLPPLRYQTRIAEVLSSYDNLIENCERRVKVLDEMAQALYFEWFVSLRYPGHRQHPLVDSALGKIPEGWKIVDVGSVSSGPSGVQTGPFGTQLHQAEYSREGVPVVMPKDLRDFRISDADPACVPEVVAQRLSGHRLEVGDIVYGRRGDIGRRAFTMPHQRGWLCGTGCLRIRPDATTVDGWYLFHHLGRPNIVSLISGRAQGVTMPNLNTSLLATVPVLLAPRPLQAQFRALTYSCAEGSAALIARVSNLRKTRDLLLPRLLSGELPLKDAA